MSKFERKIIPTNGMDSYLALVELTEPPLLFHRWCFITAVGACLARQVYLPFGEWKIYPNFYTCLIGPPGARKSVAIKIISNLLEDAGYQHFSGDRSSKEKFMMDWEFGFDKIHRGVEPEDAKKATTIDPVDELLDVAGRDTSRISEVFIKAGELEDFLGAGNSGFVSTLTNLWDNLPYYTDRFKNSKSLYIPNPTVNLLGGATTTTFASIFSATIIGQGMLSRMILVHGKGQRLRLTIPPPLPAELRGFTVELLRSIRTTIHGAIDLSPEAYDAVDYIYNNFEELPDSRFSSYSSRRFVHLLKLCLIVCASDLRLRIELPDVVLANTILTYTESFMPMALGEFGKSKNSEVSNIVLDAIRGGEATGGITAHELLKLVSQDVDSMTVLSDIVMKLFTVEKIVKGSRGAGSTAEAVFLPAKKAVGHGQKYVDYSLLWEHKLGTF